MDGSWCGVTCLKALEKTTIMCVPTLPNPSTAHLWRTSHNRLSKLARWMGKVIGNNKIRKILFEMARARFKLQRSFLRDTKNGNTSISVGLKTTIWPGTQQCQRVKCCVRSTALPAHCQRYSGTARRTTSHIPLTALLRSVSGPAAGRY
jgi:hypothetical protein